MSNPDPYAGYQGPIGQPPFPANGFNSSGGNDGGPPMPPPDTGGGGQPTPPPNAGPTVDQAMALQRQLNSMGAHLVVDGIIGPKTQAAMDKYGVDQWGHATGAQPAATNANSGAGSGGGSNAAPAAAASAPTGDIEQQIRDKYGYLGVILLDNPDIHNLLIQAIQNRWDPATVQGRLMATPYFQQTADTVRQWYILKGSDSATAQARINAQSATITQQAAALGIDIAPDRLASMAEDSLKFGWDKAQIDQAIGNEFHYKPGAQRGALGLAETSLKQMAGDYFIPLSDDTLGAWESQIAKGQATADDFKGSMIQTAKSLYQAPWMQDGLNRGLTTSQLADPYRQLAARDLEIPVDSIDFSKPQWSKPLTALSGDGKQVGMSLSDWQYTIRSDPSYGFNHTNNARQMAYDAVAELAQDMGAARY